MAKGLKVGDRVANYSGEVRYIGTVVKTLSNRLAVVNYDGVGVVGSEHESTLIRLRPKEKPKSVTVTRESLKEAWIKMGFSGSYLEPFCEALGLDE